MRYQSLGYTGDSLAHTPNIDRFAKQSVNLDQAVASMPVCSATRASLFTGKYTNSTGMVINELRMNPNHKCLAHVLTDLGYETGYIGKWHLWANQMGFHNKISNAFVPLGPHRLGFDGYWAAYNFHHDYYNTYYFRDKPEKIYYGDGSYEPDAQTDLAIDFMAKHISTENSTRKTSDDKPFFLFISYGTPHDPWNESNVPKKWFKKFEFTEFPLPPNFSRKKDPYGDMWSNIHFNPKKLKKWKRVYYAMTANLDWNFGRLMDFLKKNGMEEDTMVIFTSDHGECFGAHGRMKKNIFYEESVRIPFLIRWTHEIKKGKASDVPFNTVDIIPTLISLLGEKSRIPSEVEGTDLSSFLRYEKEKIDEEEPKSAFLMNTGACAVWEDGHEWRGLRNKNYTYAVFRDPRKEFLFDNLKDPYQLKNLADNPEYEKLLQEFRQDLKEKMKKHNDAFPNSKWYEKNWTENRIIKRTATLNYPLKHKNI